MTKAEKIQQITDLISGKITKEDLRPKSYCIMIGWSLDENGKLEDGEDDNLYLVDGVTVSREVWNREMELNKFSGTFKVEYGGADD